MAAKHPLHLALDAVRTQAKLAAIVGVTQQAISLRLKSTDPMPAEWALLIEEATADSDTPLTRYDLRPDIFGLSKDAAA